jgi:type IV secretory pathway VirB2 component (pilin)
MAATLLGAVAWFWWFRIRRPVADCTPQPVQGGSPFRWNWALALACVVGLVIAFSAMWALATANPDGQWDAWSIWNLRAKFMSGPQTWKSAVSPLLESTHPDYPLLQSAFIGMVWNLTGDADAAVPLATALVFFAAVLGCLVAGLALLRGSSAGFLAGLITLTAASYSGQPPAQYADVPLSFFFLATLLLVALAHASGRRLALFAAGLFASFAAWTKNEGVAFAGIVLLAYLIVNWRARSFRTAAAEWTYLAAGMAPGFLLTVYLKFALAPATDPLFRQGFAEILTKVVTPARHLEVLKANLSEATAVAPWYAHPVLLLAILAVCLRFDIREYRWDAVFGALTLAALFAVYWAVYLASTSLTWQLSTSLSRLHVQLWPPFLLVLFLILGRIDDRAVIR